MSPWGLGFRTGGQQVLHWWSSANRPWRLALPGPCPRNRVWGMAEWIGRCVVSRGTTTSHPNLVVLSRVYWCIILRGSWSLAIWSPVFLSWRFWCTFPEGLVWIPSREEGKNNHSNRTCLRFHVWSQCHSGNIYFNLLQYWSPPNSGAFICSR